MYVNVKNIFLVVSLLVEGLLPDWQKLLEELGGTKSGGYVCIEVSVSKVMFKVSKGVGFNILLDYWLDVYMFSIVGRWFTYYGIELTVS